MGFNRKIYYCDKCGATDVGDQYMIHVCKIDLDKKSKEKKDLKPEIVEPKKDIRVYGC